MFLSFLQVIYLNRAVFKLTEQGEEGREAGGLQGSHTAPHRVSVSPGHAPLPSPEADLIPVLNVLQMWGTLRSHGQGPGARSLSSLSLSPNGNALQYC